MLISTLSVPAIQDLITKSYQKQTLREADDVRKVFIKETADWTTDVKRIHEIDKERYAEQKVEGQSSAQRGISQGYFKDIKRKTVSVTRVVSGEAYKALTAHKLAEYASSTADDVIDKIELDMRNFLGYATIGTSYTDNGGFTIDLTVGDGLSVFDTTHTLKNSSTTYSNILSGAPSFSDTALESAEDYFGYNVTDNYGQRIDIKADSIITTSKASMMNRVARLFGSMSPATINGTANGNSGVKNVYRDRYQHLVVDFDVDSLGRPNSNLAYYWFLAALRGQTESRFQAYYISWMSPMVAPAEVNQDKWILSWTGRAAYAIGAVSGKGIVVSKATS
jgi:AraC-like DNA-binding protein